MFEIEQVNSGQDVKCGFQFHEMLMNVWKAITAFEVGRCYVMKSCRS